MRNQAYALNLRFNTEPCAEKTPSMSAKIGAKLACAAPINLPIEIICGRHLPSRKRFINKGAASLDKGALTIGKQLMTGPQV